MNVVASSAQQLTQDWPVDSTVCVEDMSWDEGKRLVLLAHAPLTPSSFSTVALSFQRAACIRTAAAVEEPSLSHRRS